MLPESCRLAQLVNTETSLRQERRDAIGTNQMQGPDDYEVILVVAKPALNCFGPAAIAINYQDFVEFGLFFYRCKQAAFESCHVAISPGINECVDRLVERSAFSECLDEHLTLHVDG